jgi:flagellin
LGVGAASGISAVGTDFALGNGDLVINGTAIEVSTPVSDKLSFANAAASSISKVAAINAKSDESGVTAQVSANVAGGTSMVGAAGSGTLTINGTSVAVDTSTSAQSSRASVTSAINAVSQQTGVVASHSDDDALGITLTAADGRNITLDYSGTLTAANTGLAETTAGKKAVLSGAADSIAPSSALDFSHTEGAKISFGVDLRTEFLEDLNFSNFVLAGSQQTPPAAMPSMGPTSFNVETDQGSYGVILNQDYTGGDADSKAYTDMITDINSQINGSGFTAGLDNGGGLTFTQDTAGSGYIKLTNGEEGHSGAATTAAIAAGSVSTGSLAAAGAGAFTFDVDDGVGGTDTVSLGGAAIGDLDALVTALNASDLTGNNADLLASNVDNKLVITDQLGGAVNITISNFLNDVGGTTGIANDDIDAMFGFDLSALTALTNTNITSSSNGSSAHGAVSTQGHAAATTGAFGNNQEGSVFGEGVDQDGTVLGVGAMSAAGRNDAVTFDIATTDTSGTYVNNVSLTESVSDLATLVTAINKSLSEDATASVSAFSNDGKLGFRTVGNFEGSITIGNFNDGGDQSETIGGVAGVSSISTADINNLFGMTNLTGSTTTPGVGSGVKGNIDLDAGAVSSITLSETSIGTNASINWTNASMNPSASHANAGINVTLGDKSVYVDTSTWGTGYGATTVRNMAFLSDSFDTQLKGTELEGQVELVSDGVINSFRATQNTDERLTLSAGSTGGTLALRDASKDTAGTGTTAFFGTELNLDEYYAANDVPANASSTGIAATTANNVLDIDIDGTTSSLTLGTGTYSTGKEMATAINAAITANADLKGKVEAFAEKGGIAIRQTDAAAASTLTVSGVAVDAILGTSATDGATSAVASSATSTVVGDGDGEVGGADTFEGGYTLLADGDVNEIVLTGGDKTGNGDLANAGLVKGTYTSGVASVNTVSKAATVETTRGAGIAGGVDTSAGVDIKAADVAGSTAILSGNAPTFPADYSGSSGNDAASFNLTYTDGDGTASSVTIGLTTNITDMESLLADINDELSVSGVGITASDNDGILEFTATTGVGAGSIAISDVELDYGGTAGNVMNVDTTLGLTGATATGLTGTAGSDAITQSNSLSFSVDGGISEAITLTAGTGLTTDTLVTDINAKLASSTNLKGATAFNEDDKVVIRSNNTANSGSIGAIGGNAASILGLNASNSTDVSKELGVKSLMAGDMVINGVSIAAVKDSYDTASYDGADTSRKGASGIALAQAINDSTDATGVTAEVNATVTIGGDGTTSSNYVAGDSGKLHINGVDLGTVVLTGNADADRVSAVYLINEKSGQTGVTAEDNGVSVSLNAADGRNLSIAIDNNEAGNTGSGIGFGAAIGLDAAVAGIGEADITGKASKTAENSYETTYSTLKLNSAGVIDIQGGLNGNSAIQGLGFEQGEFGGAIDGTFIADLDISTIEGANLAMSAIDNALDAIGAERANLGALQNRFESTSANLQVASENLTAATSRIRDADFATETAELSRTQVLQQAGISILAQANQRPQQVLSLLG